MMTPREQTAKERELHVIQLVKAKGRCGWASSPSRYANIDGITYIASSGVITAAYEIKCRNLSFPQLIIDYNSELIMDTAKVEALAKVSSVLKVPSYLLYYFLTDGVVIRTPITNDEGVAVCHKKDTTREISAGMDKANTVRKVSHIKLDGSLILSTEEPKGSI